jgi:hypothetical protein
MNKRDDFNEKVKQTLANRAGNICSNPECKKPTFGPHTDPSKSINIGVAAHITAASPGGKRYDDSIYPYERESIENGIWLCQSCAKLIDSDEYKYTVNKIKDWKKIAENNASIRLENNMYKCQHLHKELEFASIRIISESAWEKINTVDYKHEFENVDLGFRRVEFKEVDPHFDIVLLNNTNKSIIIDKVGFTFRGIIFYDIGFGEPSYIEIKKHKDYEIIVPNFQSEIQKILNDKRNGELYKYQNKDLIVQDNDDFRALYPDIPNPHYFTSYRIDNININNMIYIENQIQIKADSSYRYGLVLKDFDLCHSSKICLEVETNIGSFSSQDIIINLLPSS